MNFMRYRTFLLRITAVIVVLLGIPSSLRAAVITFVQQLDSVGASVTTSTSTYVNSGYDLYGTASVGTNTQQGTNGNGAFTTGTRLTALPAYVNSLTADGANSSFSGFTSYLVLANPAGGSVESGLASNNTASSAERKILDINVGHAPPAVFEIGVLINTAPTATDDEDEIELEQTSGGSGDSGVISTRDSAAYGRGDLILFRVVGAQAGDVLTISGIETEAHNGNGTYNLNIAGVLFSTGSGSGTATWVGAGDGVSWSDPNNWSGGSLPSPGEDVIIGTIAGNPTIQLSGTLPLIQINSLTTSAPISISNGTLQVATTIQTSQNITLFGGTIQGGTLITTGTGTLTAYSGTLSGVTLDGNLTVLGQITASNGLTLNNANLIIGAGNSNSVNTVTFQGTQTLGGTGQVLFENPAQSNSLYVQGNGTQTGAAALTLGPGITVSDPQNGYLACEYSYDSIINQGTINASTQGVTLTVGSSIGTIINSGTMSATSGGTLALGGNFATSSLGAVYATGGGTINFTGVLNNTGSTLLISATTGSWTLAGGSINGGTIAASGTSSLVAASGILNGVTMDTSLTVEGSLTVTGGLTLNSANLLIGVSNNNGANYVTFMGTQTLSGTGQVLFESPVQTNDIYAEGNGTQSGAATLTIGPGITVSDPQGGNLFCQYSYDSILNQGTINADTQGVTLTLGNSSGSFSNTGTMKATAGGALDLGGNWSTANLGTILGAGGTVNLTGVFNNTGATLAINSVSGSWNLAGGTINGGTIATTGTFAFTVNSGILNGLSITGSLTVEGSATVTSGLTLNNASLLLGNINYNGSNTVTFLGTQSINGTGQVMFESPNQTNSLYAQGDGTESGAATLTIGPGITVSDPQSGSLLCEYGYDLIVNQGTINANTQGVTVTIEGATGSFTNTGIMKSTGGGALDLGGNFTPGGLGSVQAAGGTVNITGVINNTGTTLLLNDTTGSWEISGGTIQGGAIATTGTATLVAQNATLIGVTLDSNLTVEYGLTISGGLTLNNANLILGGLTSSDYGQAVFQGTQTLSGTGQVMFAGAYSGGNYNTIYAQGGGTQSTAATLTIGPNITVDGSENGAIESQEDYDAILNEGLIDANGGGEILTLGNSIGSFSNTGTMEATNGGVLNLNGNFTPSSLGAVEAAGGVVNITGVLNNTGSTLALNNTTGSWNLVGGTIKGGSISTSGTATLTAQSATLAGVTLDSNLSVEYGLTISGGLTLNNANLILGGLTSSDYGQAIFQGTQTLSGTGQVIFEGSNGTQNFVYAQGGGTQTTAATLTIGSNITVDGIENGAIEGEYAYDAILNEGIIDASDGVTITAGNSSSSFTNNGTMESTSGGVLDLGGNFTPSSLGAVESAGGVVNITGVLNNTGSVLALNNTTGSWNLSGGTIKGGGISTSGTAILTAQYGTLVGVTLDSNLTVEYGLTISGGLALNNANLILGGVTSSDYGQLQFQGTQTLSGTGQVIFEGSYGNGTLNFVYAQGGGTRAAAATLTIGPNITVDGSENGTIEGQYAYDAILNQGVIDANLEGVTLTVGSAGTLFTNDGTMEATDAGVLDLSGSFSAANLGVVQAAGGSVNITGLINNTGSTLALNNTTGTWNLSGGTINGGAISTSGTATLVAQGGTLIGVTLNSDLSVENSLTIEGGLTLNNATLTLGGLATSDFGQMIFLGTQTLSGTGQISFAGTEAGGNYNLLYAEGGGTQATAATLTIGPDITIEGSESGTIGCEYATDSILNQGIIDANGSGVTLTVGIPNSSFTNTGTMEATDAGVLDLSGSFTTTGLGTVAGTGGAVNFTGFLNNTGNTLTLGNASGSWNLSGGTIQGGAITNSGTTMLVAQNATLIGVTLDTNLTVEYGLTIESGLTLNNANLILGGLTTSDYGEVTCLGTQTLSGTGQISFAGTYLGGNYNVLYAQGGGNESTAAKLTIGAGITVNGSQNGFIQCQYQYDSILNQGIIDADSNGITITVNGSLLTDQGTLKALNGGILSLNAPVSINGQGLLASSSSSDINVYGSLEGNTTAEAASPQPAGTILFYGPGTATSPQYLEAMSQDAGDTTAGFINNAAFGTLALSNSTYVKLVDQFQNTSGSGNNAVYARSVIVPQGSTLDLNGLNFYAASAQVAGTVLNGTISTTPTAASGGQFQFSVSSAVVHDTDGQLTVAVTRNFSGAASVAYKTVDGTAISGVEYVATSGTLSFGPSDVQEIITVPILVQDNAPASSNFSIQLLNPSPGPTVGTPGSILVTVLNNDSSVASLLTPAYTLPQAAPLANGSITVNLTPAQADGQWKLFGELDWRDSGDRATGLTSGNYEVEFKPAAGYQQPSIMVVPLLAGTSQVSATGVYTSNGNTATGSLNVTLSFPQGSGAGGWRFQGETAWRPSGQTVQNLNIGDYILEFEPVNGLAKPSNCEAVVYANDIATVNIVYLVSGPTAGASPVLISDTEAQTQAPYVFTGQIQTDEGLGTGFVPMDRVVVTAAHVLFDDTTLSYVTGVQWFCQYESGEFEPPAQIPAGSYVLDGYASQRASDIASGVSPGVATTASRQLDVAALYFLEPAALGGQSGYLGSDSVDNPWLAGTQGKFIAGYPVTGVSPTGFLYATPSVQTAFQYITSGLYSTTAIAGYPGESGSPLFVRYTDGNYYPAAIYLGGSQETVVRAIDSSVISLMTAAETSGNGGANNSGGGVIQVNEGISGALAYSVGAVTVSLAPSNAVSARAYWEIGDGVKRYNGESATGLAPGTYTIQYYVNGPGFIPPADTQVTVTAGNTTPVTGTYLANPPAITSATTALAIQGQPFQYQTTVVPYATSFSASGALPSGLTLDATSGLISGTVSSSASLTVDRIALTASNGMGVGNPTTLAITVAIPGQLTVTTSAGGAIPTAFRSPSIQAVGQSISIKATAANGFLFADWTDADTGAVLSSAQTYAFSMPPVLHLRANFAINPFLTAKGAYVPLLQGGSFAESGFANLTVAATGGFTSTFTLGGARISAHGVFNNLGQYVGVLILPGGTHYDMDVSLTAGAILTGTLTSQTDGSQIPFEAQRTASQNDQNLAGSYTVLLPTPSGPASVPDGSGFGTLKISKTGAVSFAGHLGDGIAATASGQLDSSGVFPFVFFKPQSSTAGAELLLGQIPFPPAVGGTAGTLTWYRTSNPNDHAYPAGFNTNVSFLTGYYKAPAVSYNEADVTISGADISSSALVFPISIAANGKVTSVGGIPFKFAFSAATGLFTGTFHDNGVNRAFSGAVLQSGTFGLGLFQTSSGQTGSVILQGP